jgi:carboxypeptidase family protein
MHGRHWPSLIRVSALVGALVAALGGLAAAQGTSASLSGIVTDNTRAAVPGATVTIRSIDTGQSRALVTDRSGRYRAEALQPGRYDVSVELTGFRPAEFKDVSLSVGQNSTLDVQLEIGGIAEKVVVTADANMVQTRESSVTGLVEQKQIRDLPLNGRDYSQLTLLQLGVTASPSTAQQVDRGMGTQVSVAGARPNQISYQVDGADVNTQGNGSPGSAAGGLLGVDTVREFQVLVNDYSAEYGRSSGGIVVAVTRSGTNSLNGTLFEFNRDSRFDSKTFFDSPDESIPPLKRNQFGGQLGGPIVRDHTFFFGSYEGLRQTLGTTNIAIVPSHATRARTDISPVTRPYLLLYPEPNGPENGATGQFINQTVSPTRENYAVGKIDHNLSAAQSVSVKYSWDRAHVDQNQAIPFWTTDTRTRSESFVGEHKWVISSTLLNVGKVAWNRAFESTDNIVNRDIDPGLFFIPGTRFGAIAVSGINPIGPDTGTPTFVDLKSLQLLDSLTWSHRSHAFKTGLSVTHYMNDQDSSFDFGGNYSFTSLTNFINNVPGTYEGQAPGSTTARRWRQDLIGMYAQDDWSVSRNLTLNMGVRYEFYTTPHEVDGREAHMPDLQAATVTGGGPIFQNPSYKDVAPRGGVAWNMTGDGKNVLHGGAGLFYEPILGNVYRAYGNRTPPYYNLINPASPTFPTPPSSGSSSLLRLDLLDYALKSPYRVQYNATYQRELPGRTVVTAGFVGARGYNQIRNVEYNQAIPIGLDSDGRPIFTATSKPVRRNPNFGSMRLRITDGQSWYKGLVLGATRRFSDGLSMQASYTLGRSQDLGSQAVGSADFDNSFQPAYWADPFLNKGLSDFDIRHNFVFNSTWELPFGRSTSGLTRGIVYGWQLSNIVTVRSGVPFTPVLGFDRASAAPRSGGAGQVPNLVGGCTAILGGADQYFDPNCFSLPDPGHLGNVQRNSLIGPGYGTWDLALFKNFAFHGTGRIQLRIEGFNITNHVNLGLPASTVFNSSGRVSTAGQITNIVGTARQFQFGAKVQF